MSKPSSRRRNGKPIPLPEALSNIESATALIRSGCRSAGVELYEQDGSNMSCMFDLGDNDVLMYSISSYMDNANLLNSALEIIRQQDRRSEAGRQLARIGFHTVDWDEDKRELIEIPEARQFCERLIESDFWGALPYDNNQLDYNGSLTAEAVWVIARNQGLGYEIAECRWYWYQAFDTLLLKVEQRNTGSPQFIMKEVLPGMMLHANTEQNAEIFSAEDIARAADGLHPVGDTPMLVDTLISELYNSLTPRQRREYVGIYKGNYRRDPEIEMGPLYW